MAQQRGDADAARPPAAEVEPAAGVVAAGHAHAAEGGQGRPDAGVHDALRHGVAAAAAPRVAHLRAVHATSVNLARRALLPFGPPPAAAVARSNPGAVYVDLAGIANCQQVRPGYAGEELVRPLRGPNLGVALADDDVGAVYRNPRLRRLLPLVGTSACSVAVSELAGGGPGSPAAGLGLSALLFGGLFLVILHVLRA